MRAHLYDGQEVVCPLPEFARTRRASRLLRALEGPTCSRFNAPARERAAHVCVPALRVLERGKDRTAGWVTWVRRGHRERAQEGDERR